MDFNNFSSSKKGIILGIVVLIVIVGVVSFTFTLATGKKETPTEIGEKPSIGINRSVITLTDRQDEAPPEKLELTDNIYKAVLRVDGMSCSGCIYTIKSSLSGYTGVHDVLVNISAGQAEVYYDRTQLKDVDRIADSITASGYPAKITEILSADQIRKERNLAAARSLNYIASVGEWDISRNDFNTEQEHAKTRYALAYGDDIFTTTRGRALMDNLKSQIASRLIDEGIQMQEIKKAGYTVGATTVDAEFQNHLKQKGIGVKKFKTELEKAGYSFDYYMKKFENRVLINRYLEDNIFESATNSFEKQRRYASWFNNARLLAKVVYYDKEVERLVQTPSTGGCSGGSSCSARK